MKNTVKLRKKKQQSGDYFKVKLIILLYTITTGNKDNNYRIIYLKKSQKTRAAPSTVIQQIE